MEQYYMAVTRYRDKREFITKLYIWVQWKQSAVNEFIRLWMDENKWVLFTTVVTNCLLYLLKIWFILMMIDILEQDSVIK